MNFAPGAEEGCRKLREHGIEIGIASMTWEFAEKLRLSPKQVAAVGDSSSDLEMLAAAGRRFYVGSGRPDIEGVVHLPGGNIAEIASMIVDDRTD